MALPEYFTIDRQTLALETLGLDYAADEIASVLLEPHQMTVVTHCLTPDGNKHSGPDGEIATVTTVTTVIPLRY